MSDSEDNFISRWSRRKIEARKAEAETAAATPPAAPQADAGRNTAPADPRGAQVAAGAQAPELPSLESLRGIESEYRDFLRPEVDESLRREALKKLFHDPHFNVMDGLDVYIDDYSKPDPIPEAMLRNLVHAQGLLFGGDEAQRAVPPAPAAKPAPEAEPARISQAETGTPNAGGQGQGVAEPAPAKPAGAA